MGSSAALLSQQGLISSATHPNMGFLAQPNMGLTAALLSLTWAYQQSYSTNKGLSAALLSITWAYQQRFSANNILSAALLNLT